MKTKLVVVLMVTFLLASMLIQLKIGAVSMYYLTVKIHPSGITTIPGEGWYVEGSWINLIAPLTVNGYKFDHWEVAPLTDDYSPAPGQMYVHVDHNKTATAYYTYRASKLTDNTGGTTFHGVFVGNDTLCAEDDAKEMNETLDESNGDPYKGWKKENKEVLTGAAATKAAIEKAINDAKGRAKPGDEFIFYFAGHGGNGVIGPGSDGNLDTPLKGDDVKKTNPSTGKEYIHPGPNGKIDSTPEGDDQDLPVVARDTDEDEPDRFDNYIVVFDGRITDDELARWLSGFNFSVTIVVVLDSCYSGTFTDGKKDLNSITEKQDGKDVPLDHGHLEVQTASCSETMESPYKWEDKNGDGKVDPNELSGPLYHLKNCSCVEDKNKNGLLDPGEIVPPGQVKWKGDFTYQLLKGLARDGKDNMGVDTTNADTNKDGTTTAKELYDSAEHKLKEWYESNSDGDGKLDEDGMDHLETEDGIYHLEIDNDGDGWIDEDPPPTYIPTYFEIGHNIGVRSVKPQKTVVGQGYSLSISVIIANQGNYTETFDVTLYANVTSITGQTIYALKGGNRTILTFVWTTSGFAKGNYTVEAIADTVPGETDIGDNSLTDGWVFVAMVGDVDANRKVDMIDLWMTAKAFGSYPGHVRWVPECDVDNNGNIDMQDLWIVAREFGKIDP